MSKQITIKTKIEQAGTKQAPSLPTSQQIRGQDNELIVSQMLADEIQQAKERQSSRAILKGIVEDWVQ